MAKRKTEKDSAPPMPEGLTKGQLALYRRCQRALESHLGGKE